MDRAAGQGGACGELLAELLGQKAGSERYWHDSTGNELLSLEAQEMGEEVI